MSAIAWLEQLSLLLEFQPARKMNRTADLDTALGFVIARIEEEAARSGEPLGDEQRFSLNHLPTGDAPSIIRCFQHAARA